MSPVSSTTLGLVARCLVLDAVVAELVPALHGAGVDAVLLKGPATVRWLYADDPHVRLYSDVDLLVAPAEFAAASRVMQERGFRSPPPGAGVVQAEDGYSVAWVRAEGERVDLHRGFHHVAQGSAFWEVISGAATAMTVAECSVLAPDPAGTALICALHAAANGTTRPESAKPREDLRRAIMQFDADVWGEAAQRARALAVSDAVAVALRMHPAGIALASDLNLPTVVRPFTMISASAPDHRGNKTVAQFAEGSTRKRLLMLRNVVVPAPGVLDRYGAADAGPALAYVRRVVGLAADTPTAVGHWRSAVRAAEESGWRPRQRRGRYVRAGLRTVRDPDRLMTVWWSVRAVRAARRQLRDSPPDEVTLPRLPVLRGAARPRVGTLETAARLVRASCLESALARQQWLAAAGEPRDLVLGVTAPSTGFRAHAWLERDPVSPEFAELRRFPAPTPPAPRLPDFVVIGVPKSGTTSLWSYLRAHPQIFMSSEKEVEFFNDETNWSRGVGWYRGHFADAEDALIVGEASVRYATPRPASAKVPERMAAVIPDAKLVYVVRHPVYRMASQWRHNRTIYAERRPMSEAMRSRHYLESSRYADRLAPFLAHYPADRLHIVVTERLAADRHTEMRRLFTFLGVDPEAGLEGTGQELNRALAKPVPRPWMHTVMGLRGAPRARAALLRVAPRRLVTAATPLTRTAAVRDVVPDSLVAELSPLFADDVRRLRPYVAGNFDGWGIA